MPSPNAMVPWREEYALGLDAIDEQHQVLIELLNRLWKSIVNRSDQTELLAILEELEKYTLTHFTAEEAFMATVGYEDLPRHKKAHALFIERIASEKRNLSRGQPMTLDLLKFLKEWLVDHILVSDKAYAVAYRSQQQPESGLGRFFKRLWTQS